MLIKKDLFYGNHMKIWPDDNDILMYSTCNRGKPVVADRFIKILKDKIYKILTAHDSKFYLRCLNKFLDECNNTYHHSICKNLLMLIILLCLKKLNQDIKLLSLKGNVFKFSAGRNAIDKSDILNIHIKYLMFKNDTK